MSDEQCIGYGYITALGTPFPVGAQVLYKGVPETISKYDFSISNGLVATTQSGKQLSDYDHLADAERKVQIKRFFSAAKRVA